MIIFPLVQGLSMYSGNTNKFILTKFLDKFNYNSLFCSCDHFLNSLAVLYSIHILVIIHGTDKNHD